MASSATSEVKSKTTKKTTGGSNSGETSGAAPTATTSGGTTNYNENPLQGGMDNLLEGGPADPEAQSVVPSIVVCLLLVMVACACLYGLLPLVTSHRGGDFGGTAQAAAAGGGHRVGETDVPRLAHVVEEIQPWKEANYIAAGVMLMTFFAMVLGMITYRRVRAQRARQLDPTFWFLCAMSVLSGILFVLYRMRERKRHRARQAVRGMTTPSRISEVALFASLLLLMVGLLLYRRYTHSLHVAARRRRKKSKPSGGGGGGTKSPGKSNTVI